MSRSETVVWLDGSSRCGMDASHAILLEAFIVIHNNSVFSDQPVMARTGVLVSAFL